MAFIISICNHKGGVGKTTTVVNLAHALAAYHEQRVLVVDADPQGNASMSLGRLPPHEAETTIADVFLEKEINFSRAAQPSKYKGVDLIPANIQAATLGMKLGPNDSRRASCFRYKLQDARERWDIIVIDCPPSLDGVFLVNALNISDFYIVPIETESKYALAGVDNLLATVEVITELENPGIRLLGSLVTRMDARRNADQRVAEAVVTMFGVENTFRTRIHTNAAISRANTAGKSVFEHEPKSRGAKAYKSLATEVMARCQGLPYVETTEDEPEAEAV